MVQWTTFAGITGVVLVLLLVLSHLTQSAVSDSAPNSASRSGDAGGAGDSSAPAGADANSRSNANADADVTDSSTPPGAGDSSVRGEANPDTLESAEHDRRPDRPTVDGDGPDGARRPAADSEHGSAADGAIASGSVRRDRRSGGIDPDSLSTGELLANVALSQGLFAFVLLGAVLYTGIPADALGVEFSRAYVAQGAVWGTAVGLALYAANELGTATATRLGFDHDEELRSMLAPDALRGWLVLLLIVLPIIAFFEELLFRAALIGVVSSGFSISPWLLAALSSVAFALGHGMQGSVGIVVTGVLGFVLAAVFVVTGSFLVVVVAHYLINALEFVVHEGLDFDWAETLES